MTHEWKNRMLYTGGRSSGVSVNYVKKHRAVHLGGWYDSICGIEDAVIPLGEFLRGLGITERDCRKALLEKVQREVAAREAKQRGTE